MATYKIDHTAPTVYLDKFGKVVNGFQVSVTLLDFNEAHLLSVPSLDPETVKAEIKKLLDDRKALDNLTEE